MTRRYCACGQTRWTDGAFELHITPGRPGCREISRDQYADLHGDPDQHRERAS